MVKSLKLCVRREQVGQYKIDTISPPWHIFGSPGGTPGAIGTKMRDAAYRSDLRPYAKFRSFVQQFRGTNRHRPAPLNCYGPLVRNCRNYYYYY